MVGKKWKVNGWKNSQRQPVSNVDLWQPLIDLLVIEPPQPKFKWVKGHSGDP